MNGRILAAVVALQLAVPAVALALDAPTRFGFQMYSGQGDNLTVSAVNRHGHIRRVDLSTVAANPRPELDWTQHLPEYLCATGAGYRSVTVSSDHARRELTCPR